jgi:hypothetical protein
VESRPHIITAEQRYEEKAMSDILMFSKPTREEAEAKKVQLLIAGYSSARISQDKDGHWNVYASHSTYMESEKRRGKNTPKNSKWALNKE